MPLLAARPTRRSAKAPRRLRENLETGLATGSICTAEQMAKANGINPNVFRSSLRKAEFPWHGRSDRWTVVYGSPEHADMERAIRELMAK